MKNGYSALSTIERKKKTLANLRLADNEIINYGYIGSMYLHISVCIANLAKD